MLMAEFIMSNHVNTSTNMTSFFANYSFYPQTGIKPSETYKREWQVEMLAVNKIVTRQEEMMSFLQD